MNRIEVNETGEVSILVASDAKHAGGGLATFIGWDRLEAALKHNSTLGGMNPLIRSLSNWRVLRSTLGVTSNG